jgi:hypothetical protein
MESKETRKIKGIHILLTFEKMKKNNKKIKIVSVEKYL